MKQETKIEKHFREKREFDNQRLLSTLLDASKNKTKALAYKAFQAGKNNLPDRMFNTYFEEYYRQMQEDKETGVWN